MLRTLAGLALVSLALAAPAAPAAAQLGSAVSMAEWTGTRSVAGGDVGYVGNYSNFTLGWTITAAGAGTYRYEYTFGNVGPDISHLILGLTSSCTSTNACITQLSNASYDDPTFQSWSQSNSNPTMPGSFYGVKFAPGSTANDGTYTFAFTSDRAPVWGDFYAKGGSANGNNTGEAWNLGLEAANRSSMNNDFFVARPDGNLAVVPEPSTYVLMGTGLLGLVGVARRRKAQQG